MSAVRRLYPYAPSESLRGLAKARHVDGIIRLAADDRVGFLRRLRDVDQITEHARQAERYEAECRAVAAVCDRILELAAQDGERR